MASVALPQRSATRGPDSSGLVVEKLTIRPPTAGSEES
eukprot:SAG31_NODE_20070_length_584_cov_1.369072_1_plen_37_part_01